MDDFIRRSDRSDQVLDELQQLRAEIDRMRAESVRDRFWTHLGVESTMIALGLGLVTYPRPTNTTLFSNLSVIEGGVLLAGSALALLVTIGRRSVGRK